MSLTLVVFLLGYFGTLLLGLVRHPIFAVYAYLLTLYMNPDMSWWGRGLPDLRWSLVAALVMLVATFRRRGDQARVPWFGNPMAKLLLIFVIWMWIQSIWALAFRAHIDGCVVFTKVLLLYVVLDRIFVDAKSILKFMLANVAGAAYLGWTTLGSGGRLDNVGGALGDANLLAMNMSVVLTFAGFLFLHLRTKMRWVLLLMIPFILNVIIETASRGAFLGLVAAAPVALMMSPSRYRTRTVLAGALALVLLSMLAHHQFWKRISTLRIATEDVSELDTSARTRIALIGAGWRMFKDHPFGAGYRGTAALSPYYLDERFMAAESGRRAAHNVPMAVLVEQGIPGMLIYLLAVWTTFRRLRRLRHIRVSDEHTDLAVIRAAVGTALVIVLVDTQFGNFLRAEIQYFCLAMLVAVERLARDALPVPKRREFAPAPYFERGAPADGQRGGTR